MTGLYLTEIEAVTFFFDVALLSFLLVIRKRTDSIRLSFLRFFALVTASTLFDVVQALLINYNRMNPHTAFPLTAVLSAAQVVELSAAGSFILYAMDQADLRKETIQRVTRVLTVTSVIYALLQGVNLFTGILHHFDADKNLIRGPLFVPVTAGYPLLYLFAGFLVFRIRKSRYTGRNAMAIISALAFTLSGIFFRHLFAPFVLSGMFGASAAAFILYFALETPPFVELRQRLHEVEEAEERAAEEKRHAEREDFRMNEFLANMSHEIRTPLTAILGYDEVILNTAEEEDVREYAQDILNAGNTLLYIVGDILDFSKMESGELSLSVGTYHLHDVLDNLDNMIRKKARDKGLEYRTDIDGSIPDMLTGDGIRVNQILLNVLNNAVKYTMHGYVQLTMRASYTDRPDEIVLEASVEDSGIGIREADRDKLFNAFLRLDEERNTDVEGTGLGLAITSKLLQMMNGTIRVESSYGEGSVFYITIPQTLEGEQTIGMYAEERARLGRKEEERLLAPSARILVVDDNLTNRTVVGELLTQTMIAIDTAESGAQCLDMVKEHAYDVILMDQMMPNMSGPQTLENMRDMGAGNKSARARVIAFTADAVAGAKEKLLEQGFDDYLSKPVTTRMLIRMLKTHLPEDKVINPGDEGYADALKLSRERMKSEAQKSREQLILEELKGINLADALALCGTKDVLLAAVKDFYKTIRGQADLIEQYMKEGDVRNYTIKVHALKSAAAFIGARKLSDDAAYLERMGNRRDTDEIKEKTPALLELYRSYLEKLRAIDPHGSEDGEDRELISQEDLSDAYEEIRMFAEDFYFDGVDAVMESLAEYRIPDDMRKRHEQISEAVLNVNREALLALLSNASTKET